MSNTVIIYGYSNLGKKIASILKNKKYDLIIVEPDIKLFKEAKDAGFEKIYNYSLMEDNELLQIGINEKVKAFFCTTKSILNNLFVTLSVRNLNKQVRIISSASTKGDGKKMLLAGANKIINPYEIGALRIFRMLHKPLILEVLDNIMFSDSKLNIAEFTIDEKSSLNGQFMREIDFNKNSNILVIGIADKELGEDFIFNSSGINHKIDVGDTLVVMGYSDDLKEFKKLIEGRDI